MSWIGSLFFIICFTLTTLGGFSRLTHGRYTPAYYAYQLDRAPDDESTRVIPYVDLTLAAFLAYKPTRAVAAAVCGMLQFFGIIRRVREDKNAAPDLAILLSTLVLSLDCLLGD